MMLPRRTRIVIGIAWVLFWTLMITTALQEYLRGPERQLWQPVLWEGSSALTATVLLLLQRRATRRHDALLATPARWFGRQLRWLPVYWLAFVPIAFGIRHAVYALAGQRYTHAPWLQTWIYESVKMTIFFGIFTAIMFGLLSYHALLDEKLRAERANASLREAQLLRLTRQMQPHFLFNALNTISSLMHADVARADAMLLQLADVLRATLDTGEQHQVTLAMELRLLRGYASLMSERFADRVSIAWHIDPGLLDCVVPVMSMQPLLENIFKHTVEPRRQSTRIAIAARRDGRQLVLLLEDDSGTLAVPTPAAGVRNQAGGAAGQREENGNSNSNSNDNGIGVRNLRQRLAALHGDTATFELTQLAPAGVRAEMRLPCGC